MPDTFTQDVHHVPAAETQVLGPLGLVVVLCHHLAEEWTAPSPLWQGGRLEVAQEEVPHAAHGHPHSAPPHPALELQPSGAQGCVPPGTLQLLLPRDWGPGPSIAGGSVAAKCPQGGPRGAALGGSTGWAGPMPALGELTPTASDLYACGALVLDWGSQLGPCLGLTVPTYSSAQEPPHTRPAPPGRSTGVFLADLNCPCWAWWGRA